MGPIDRKLYSLGYTIQEEDSNSYTYVRSLNIAGSGFGYSHKVKIVGTKKKVILQSSMIGGELRLGKRVCNAYQPGRIKAVLLENDDVQAR